MANKNEDKIAWFLIIIAFAMGGCAVILFNIYKDTNALIYTFAKTLLYLAGLVMFYLKFYWDIKPFWVGIILTLILFFVFLAVSFAVIRLFPKAGNLTGIPIAYALAILLNYFEKPINKALVSIFKRKGQK